MADTTVPEFFERFPMTRIVNTDLDADLAADDHRIAILMGATA